MSSLLSIEAANHRSFKDQAKIAIGKTLSVLLGPRAGQLAAAPESNPLGIIDRMLMAYLRDRAQLANDTVFFERLHAEFWQGQGGEVFSTNCDHRFEDFFHRQAGG